MDDKDIQEILKDAVSKNSKKKIKFSKKVVALVILLNVLFTIGVFVIALKGALIPDALIVAWFSFTTGELWFLSTIKKSEGGQ